jgi:uncharacterized protein YndB with AHSA1/START domain
VNPPVYQYDTYIRASAERIWQALTQAEFTERYFHATRVESDWQVGSEVIYHMPDGSTAVEGRVLVCEPFEKLVITWRPRYSEELASEAPSRVSFEIQPVGDACRLLIRHDEFQPDSQVYEQIQGGWSAIVCSLKSLLETGEPLAIAGNEAAGS